MARSVRSADQSGDHDNLGIGGSIFRWHDDWKFVLPGGNQTGNGAPPGPGQRPSSTRRPTPRSTAAMSRGFLTVYPSLQPGMSTVCAVVCYKRVLATTGEATYTTATCDSATGYGGIGVSIAGNGPVTSDPPLKNDQWVLLYTTTTGVSGTTPQCTWYRVVNVGFDGTNTRVNLVGPDWNGDGTGTNPPP